MCARAFFTKFLQLLCASCTRTLPPLGERLQRPFGIRGRMVCQTERLSTNGMLFACIFLFFKNTPAVLSTNHGAICRSIVSSEMLSFCADVSAVPALQAGSAVQRFRSFFNVFPETFREHVFHFERPAFPKRSHNSRKSFIILSFISIIFRFTQHSFFIQILFLLF